MTNNNTPWEEDSIQVNDADGNLAFEVIDLVKPDKLVPTFVKGAEYSDWRKDLEENWSNITTGNKVGQTFKHVSGTIFTTGGAIGGVETVPSTTTVYGDTVAAPDVTKYAIQGYAIPFPDLVRKTKKEPVNPKLDASEKVAKKANADELMKARVEDVDDEKKVEILEKRAKEVLKYKEELKKHEVKLDIRARDIDKIRNTRKNDVNKFLTKYKTNINNVKWTPTPNSSNSKWESYTVGNGKLIIIKSNGVFWNDGDKISAEVYSNYQQRGNEFSNISGLVKSGTFNIKEPSLSKEPEPPEFMKKNLSKGWQIVTEGDEEFIKKQEKNILFNVKHLYPGAELAGKLALQLAKGDMTTFSKSPGKGFDKQVMNLIGRQIDNNIKGNVVNSDVYGKAGTLEKGLDLPVRLSIGQFTWNKTSEGIEVYDNFDFDLNTAVGYGSFIPGLQKTANKFVSIMMRRSAELGFNMKSGTSPISPVYEGEENYHGGLATPDGFDLEVKYTIPWNQVSSELKSKVTNGKKKDVTKDHLSLAQPIVRRKPKSNWRSELNV